MCQLTLTNLHDRGLNRLFVYSSFINNTVYAHKDGCGFFSKSSGVVKAKDQPRFLIDIGTYIRDYINDDGPVLAHVRQATATNNIKHVSRENSHPFDTKNIVLAHNGSLESKNLELMKEDRFKGKIDSEIFAMVLSDSLNKVGNLMYDGLRESYAKFDGKFAFLIYSKITDYFYVVRGETAKLFISTLTDADTKERLGVVINTEEESLELSIIQFSNMRQLLGEPAVKWTKPTLIKENTVFGLDWQNDALVELGELKETKKYAPAKEVQVWTGGTNTKNGWNSGTYYSKDKNTPLTVKMLDFAETFDLTPEEIDELMLNVLGISLLEATTKDIETFVDHIIPQLITLCKKTPKLKKIWSSIKYRSPLSALELVTRLNIQFPYMLNTLEEIKNANKEIRRDYSN